MARMDTRARRCAVCDSAIAPFETYRALGIPIVHRYRCGCGTRFDIATTVGASLLVGLNTLILGAVLFAPASKFASSEDRTYIGLALLGVQIPAVALTVWRSAQNGRLHARIDP